MKLENFYKEECFKCNVKDRVKNKSKCNNCIFSITSQVVIKKKFPISNLRGIPKHHFFFFIYHPKLNWKFPKTPEIDSIGNRKDDKKRWRWEIHHKNKIKYDDREENLKLILNTEHIYLHRKEYNPMNDINIINKIKRKNYEKIKNKTYYSIVTPTLTYSKKYQNVKNWLENLKNGKYLINTNLSKKFNYSESYSFRACISGIIKRFKLGNLRFEHNRLKTNSCKWYLIKF